MCVEAIFFVVLMVVAVVVGGFVVVVVVVVVVVDVVVEVVVEVVVVGGTVIGTRPTFLRPGWRSADIIQGGIPENITPECSVSKKKVPVASTPGFIFSISPLSGVHL